MTLSGGPRDSVQHRGLDLEILIKDLRQGGKKSPIFVKSWSSVKDVKDTIQSTLDLPCHLQRLYFGPLLSKGCELKNHWSLHDVGIYKSGETLLMDLKEHYQQAILNSMLPTPRGETSHVSISPSMAEITPSHLTSLVQHARRGFAVGLKPELVLDGSGGTYYMHDTKKNKIAVFKPADEEPYAENNPRGYLQQPGGGLSLRQGIEPGKACIREVAAYLLDHGGFSSVPMTTLAEARHRAFNTNGARLTVAAGGAAVGWHSAAPNSPVKSKLEGKAGSFQEYVRCECTMDDLSPTKISADEVHKIAILDIRLMNADRNSANLLVRRRRDNSLQLVPIDHGYCLRSVCDVSWMDWCWLDWPHLKEPLSEESRKYILNLDIEADARVLHERLNIGEKAIDNFRASSMLLKAGVKAGLCLYDIAVLCCRNDNLGEIPSRLEAVTSMASEIALKALKIDKWQPSTVSRALEAQLSSPKTTSTTNLPQSASRIHKSVSSAEFRTEPIFGDPDDLCFPDMAPSSASSDSSSETGSVGGEVDIEDDDETEACDEWAAVVVNGVMQEMKIDEASVYPGSERGCSVHSDDSSLAASPGGFWDVHPAASPSLSDDGSGLWSPPASPKTLGPKETLMRSIAVDLPLSPSERPSSPARVRFSGLSGTGGASPLRTVKFAEIFSENVKDHALPSLVRVDSGMGRSKSYSALSSLSFDQQMEPTERLPKPHTQEYAVYLKSYHSFMDLLMIREATMALQRAISAQY